MCVLFKANCPVSCSYLQLFKNGTLTRSVCGDESNLSWMVEIKITRKCLFQTRLVKPNVHKQCMIRYLVFKMPKCQ